MAVSADVIEHDKISHPALTRRASRLIVAPLSFRHGVAFVLELGKLSLPRLAIDKKAVAAAAVAADVSERDRLESLALTRRHGVPS